MTQYPDETTRRHLLALTKAGVIKPGSIRAQVAEVVADYRLIMEHAIEAEKVAESKECEHLGFRFPIDESGHERCSHCLKYL